MSKKIVMAGVDIGGTNTALGLVDDYGNCLRSVRFRTVDFPEAGGYVAEVARLINELLQPDEELKGVGVGAPNGNYYTGRIEHAPNLPWGPIVELSQLLEDALEVPVVVTNDANAAAFGEGLSGGATEMKNYVMVTIGTGLGSGIVVNGQLLHGYTGFAGEMGHICAVPHGRQCSCGKKGCLETYVSGRGIVQTASEILEREAGASTLRQVTPGALTAHRIFEAATEGDPVAIQAFREMGKLLGTRLADVVALLSPEAIFLFGGLCKAGELLFGPVREALEASLLPMYRGKVKLLPSELTEENAAVMGASALIRQHLT